jgi:hyaluronate lyase
MKAVFLTLVLSVVPAFLLPAQVINFTNYSPTGATLNWNSPTNNWNPNTVPNAVGVTANFSQTSNSIPLSVNISWGANSTVGNLWSTNSSGFVIVGGSTLTLAVDGVMQTVPTINIGSSSFECWIKGGYLAGTNGFLKTGANKLTFRYDGNTNAGLSGPVVIGQGSLGFQIDGNLGDSHNSLTFSNGITFALESGTAGASVTLAPTRNVHLASASTAANITALSGQTLTIPGVIDELSAGSKLVWNGSGAQLVLSGGNTYSGATTISAGTLTVNGAGQLGGGNYTATIANSGVFNFNSLAAQILSGVISGSGPLNKNGSGTLTLGAADTYGGATTINAGTLVLGSGGSINNTPSITLAAGAIFDVSAITAYTLSSSTTLTASGSVAATVIKGNAGGTVNLGSRPITLNFDGANPALVITQGTLSLSGQTITVNTPQPIGNGTYNIIQQTTGNVTHSGTYTLAGTAGTGTITSSGGNVQMNITGSSSTATTTTLSGNDSEIYGNSSIITATVSPGTATGTIQFYVDGTAFGGPVALSGGTAAIPATTTIPIGTHSIAAVYSGAAGCAPSASTNAVTLTLTPRPLTVSATGVNKNFDGTSNATVVLSDNRLAGDTVADTYASAFFAATNVANNILVTVTGVAISGSAATNYWLANTSATTTASILPALPPVTPAEFANLRLYWQNYLTGTNNSAATLNSLASSANSYWSTLNTSASRTYLWSDLPLGSGQPGINTGSSHMDSTFGRLATMAQAWATTGCSLQGNAALASAITNSLDWMCANVYTTTGIEYDNWWDWEIGGLQNLNNAVLLIYPALTAGQITNYNACVDHYQPPNNGHVWYTGANLTDQCKGMFIRAIIGQNSNLMTTAQLNLSPVFVYVTNSDGFYLDGSFVFHTYFPYTGGYGVTLLADVGQLVNLLNGSSWQITDPNLNNVFNWVFQSFMPVCYHGEWMAMVQGRTFDRGPAGSGGVPWMIPPVEQFAPAAKAAAIASWSSTLSMPPSQYQFASMDCVVAWRTNFCVGLRMSSSRIANYESFAGENLHGWFMGDGIMYLYIGSGESQFTGDFWPTVDMYHLPGTTAETVARANAAQWSGTTTGQPWVGGAQVANLYGTAGMSLAAVGTTLTAKKSWFMFDNEVVCLGAGITCGDASEVDTTVEDRRLGTSPTSNLTVNGVVNPPVIGWSSNLTSASWCALDGVAGYYFPGSATNLHAAFVANTGSWYAINNNESTTSYTDDYLTLWFNHGDYPTNASYAYVVLPNYTSANMAAYAASPDMVVITNTTTVQAARKPATGLVAANFWVDGTNSAGLITANKQSAVIVSQNSLQISVGVADPTQTNSGSITVILNSPATAVLSADPGVTVVQLSPQIVLSVNVNGSAGKTYQAAFSSPANSLTWDANPSGAGTHPLDGSGTWNNSNTNWWSGSADVAWNDANPSIANFGAYGTAGVVNVAGAHTNSWLLFNPTASGTYTLSGSGSLTIDTGIVANASANVNVPLNLAFSQTWTVASNQDLSLGAAVTPSASAVLSLAGGGKVGLNGGKNQLPTSAIVGFAGNGILELGGNSQTLANLMAANGYTGSLQNGSLIVTAVDGFNPFGTLTTSSTLDLSGLSSFTYSNASQSFTVQGTVSTGGSFNLNLAGTSGWNSLTATNIYVGNGGGTSIPTGNLYLGQTNVFNTGNFQLGAYRGSGNVYFESGMANSNVTFRGVAGGTNRLGTMSIGWNQSGAVQNQIMDLGVANVDALIGTLNLLYTYQPQVASTATLNFGNGTFDITTLNLFYLASGNSGISAAAANFNQNGGLAKIQTLNMGYNSIPATGLAAFNANYTLGTGATLAAQTITAIAGTPYNTDTVRNLNLNGGTVSNYDAATDLTICGADGTSGGVVNLVLGAGTTSTFNAGNGRAIKVQGTASISGSGGLAKSGGGWLTLAGTNIYAGGTLVSAGTMLVNGWLGTNTVTVSSGATLGGTGIISGTVDVQSGGTLLAGNTNGTGILTVGALNFGDSPSAITTNLFSVVSRGMVSATRLSVSGKSLVCILDNSLPLGTNTLLNYTGTIGGVGFGGFALVSTPVVPSGAGAYLRNTGAALQLVVAPLTAPTLNRAVSKSGGALGLSFTGVNGQSFRVLSSTNLILPLTNWLTLTNGTFGAGQIDFLDSSATNDEQFYRVASP